MRVWSAILITLYMAAASEAQVRGMGQGFRGRGAFPPIPPVVSPVPPVVSPNVSINPGFRQGFIPGFGYYGLGFGPGFGIYPSGAPVLAAPYPYYYTYNPYGPYPDFALPNPVTSYYQESSPDTPPPERIINDLTGEIQRLTGEVQQLRDELSSVSAPAPPPPEVRSATPEKPPTPTVLILRDGRRFETQGYVIAGPTLWIVGDKGPLSFALADLDIASTRAENLKRGIKFLAPQ